MSGRFKAVVLALTLAPSLAQGQAANSPASSPTMEETAAWIESHIVGLEHGSRKTVVTYKLKKGKPPRESDRQVTNTHESVASAKFDGCSLTIGQLFKGDDYTVLTTSIVPLDRVFLATSIVEKQEPSKTENSQEITNTDVAPASRVVLTLEASTKVISYRRKSTGNVALEWDALPFEGTSATLTINSDDEEMPPRLAKAFNHAILLCHSGKKVEPF
jgi:hypothetical protein